MLAKQLKGVSKEIDGHPHRVLYHGSLWKIVFLEKRMANSAITKREQHF